MSDSRSDSAIPIIFEDNHLLVVIKPRNMPSQEDDSGDLDLLNALKADLKVRYEKPGNVYLGLVHRLDRPVGGLMVFAKTSKAAARLSETIRSRKFGKSYLAVAHGTFSARQGRLTHFLYKDTRTNTVSAVASSHAEAKEAILDYEVIGQHNGLSLLQIELLTGRPHQIRVQLATTGHPLFGDQRYGGSVTVQQQQIALWSRSLSFEHPVTRLPLHYTANPPSELPWTHWI